MLNNIVSTYKMKRISCKFPKYPYLCIVFFIVLDLRLTKVGARRCSFFMSIRYLRIQSAFSIAFFINGSMISYPSLFGCTPSFVY